LEAETVGVESLELRPAAVQHSYGREIPGQVEQALRNASAWRRLGYREDQDPGILSEKLFGRSGSVGVPNRPGIP
jgi:hypothetical protein